MEHSHNENSDNSSSDNRDSTYYILLAKFLLDLHSIGLPTQHLPPSLLGSSCTDSKIVEVGSSKSRHRASSKLDHLNISERIMVDFGRTPLRCCTSHPFPYTADFYFS